MGGRWQRKEVFNPAGYGRKMAELVLDSAGYGKVDSRVWKEDGRSDCMGKEKTNLT